MIRPGHPLRETLAGRAIDGGRYQVEALVGEGGMGQVYAGRQASVNRRVALKFLHSGLADDPGLLARFEREAKSISRLRHPNIISLIDHGKTEEDRLFMVMELLGGESLADRLVRTGPLPTGTVVHIACQVVSALVEAHGAGIIHRDLKPENIHLDEVAQDPNFVKVLDFGIAKIVEGPNTLPPNKALTLAGAVFGTPQYMSPEQVKGDPIDHRSDLYAVGVILFEMLAGRPPFDGGSPSAVMIKQATEELPLVVTINPDITGVKRLQSLIALCCQKKVEDRIESAVVLLTQLRELAIDFPNRAPRLSRPPREPTRTVEMGSAPTLTPVESAARAAAANKDPEFTLTGIRTGPKPVIWVALAALVGVGAIWLWPDASESGSKTQASSPSEPQSGESLAGDSPAPPAVKRAEEQKSETETQPTTAWVRLQSSPVGAAVFRAEVQLGVTPFDWTPKIEKEPVELRFTLAGHRPQTRTLTLVPKGEESVLVETPLQPIAEAPPKVSPQAPAKGIRKGPPKKAAQPKERRKKSPKPSAPKAKKHRYEKL